MRSTLPSVCRSKLSNSQIIELSEVDMIKTKTKKTPLMKSVAFGPTYCPSVFVLKSTLLHNPEVQYGFVPKHSLHGGKNPALRAKKQLTSPDLPDGEEGLRATDVDRIKVCISFKKMFFSEASVFASEDVLRCEAICGDVMVCAGACSQAQSHEISTETRRAKTSEEGFLRFLLTTET